MAWQMCDLANGMVTMAGCDVDVRHGALRGSDYNSLLRLLEFKC
jgi:hypothetical protein